MMHTAYLLWVVPVVAAFGFIAPPDGYGYPLLESLEWGCMNCLLNM